MGWGRYRGSSVTSFAEAAAVLKKRETKKVAHNTYVVRTAGADCLALLYHATRIIHWYSNGDIVLHSGGWQTYSTKDRMNGFSPRGQWTGDAWEGFSVSVSQNLGTWYVHIRTENGLARTVHFQDGMRISRLGQVTLVSTRIEVPDADPDADRREYLRRKARERRENHRLGLVWQGRGRFGGWRHPVTNRSEAVVWRNVPQEPPRQLTPAELEAMDRAQIAQELENRDRRWRAAQMRKASDDPRSAAYVPEFARGNGKA